LFSYSEGPLVAGKQVKKESGSRAKILELLRERDSTVRELAARVGLTKPGIRAHLIKLEEEGLVRRGGSQSGSRKPHVLYALTPDAAHAFPNAYPLLLCQLLRALVDRLSPRAVAAHLRQVGRELAGKAAEGAAGKSPQERRRIALRVLDALGGEASLLKMNGTEFIEGRACPLSAVTASHPEACLIAQAALEEVIGQPVREHCIRGSRPRCRFQILS
jgi:predicted ArsR family transcriptional regulator